MKRAIKIIRFVRGFHMGRIYDHLPPGQAQTMVDCGKAEWIEEQPEEAPPPVQVAVEEPKASARGRKR